MRNGSELLGLLVAGKVKMGEHSVAGYRPIAPKCCGEIAEAPGELAGCRRSFFTRVAFALLGLYLIDNSMIDDSWLKKVYDTFYVSP